jgi:hypothetical protein
VKKCHGALLIVWPRIISGIYRGGGDHDSKPPPDLEDVSQQIWRGPVLPYAAHARHRCGPLARLRSHEQIAAAHRDECCRTPAGIVINGDKVEIRSCAHKRLALSASAQLSQNIEDGTKLNEHHALG